MLLTQFQQLMELLPELVEQLATHQHQLELVDSQ